MEDLLYSSSDAPFLEIFSFWSPRVFPIFPEENMPALFLASFAIREGMEGMGINLSRPIEEIIAFFFLLWIFCGILVFTNLLLNKNFRINLECGFVNSMRHGIILGLSGPLGFSRKIRKKICSICF